MALFQFLWLPRLLFTLTIAAALFLGATVLAAPFVQHLAIIREWRVIHLFAVDATLRRTTAASAFGLVVTAWVFFRQPRAPRPAPDRPANQSPAGMTGA